MIAIIILIGIVVLGPLAVFFGADSRERNPRAAQQVPFGARLRR